MQTVIQDCFARFQSSGSADRHAQIKFLDKGIEHIRIYEPKMWYMTKVGTHISVPHPFHWVIKTTTEECCCCKRNCRDWMSLFFPCTFRDSFKRNLVAWSRQQVQNNFGFNFGDSSYNYSCLADLKRRKLPFELQVGYFSWNSQS